MDDTQVTQQDTGTQEPTTTDDAQAQAFTPITSQEQFDRMVKERVERARRNAIPADYDELKAKAAQLDKKAGELERAAQRATEAEAEAAELRHVAELSQWRDEVAAQTGVPASVLRGDTLEEIRAHAEAIKGAMPVYPQVREHSGGALPMSKADILAIKNPKERKAAILANLSQF